MSVLNPEQIFPLIYKRAKSMNPDLNFTVIMLHISRVSGTLNIQFGARII
jgi:hypothetical protein